MIKAKVEKGTWPYRYHVDGMENVEFKHCSLGRHRGKEFMVTNDGKVREFRIITKEMGGFTHPVVIPTEIEYAEEALVYDDVFYDLARKAKFAIEDGTVFEGYSYNEYWNGWFVPYGTKETVDAIAKEFELKDARYDEKEDNFYYIQEDEHKEYVFGFGVGLCNTDDGLKHLYRLGDGWIWSESESEEEDYE